MNWSVLQTRKKNPVMHKIYIFLVGSIFLVVRSAKVAHSFFPLTLKDRLIVDVFRNGPASSWLSCLERCSKNTNCVAYNYFPPSFEEDGHCELSLCGIEHSCSVWEEESPVSLKGSFVHQIRPSQVMIDILTVVHLGVWVYFIISVKIWGFWNTTG